MKKYFVLIILLLTFTISYGMIQEETSPILDQLLPLLNTVAVWLAVKGTTLLKKIAPAWILGILVPGFSALGAWLIGMVSPDSSFLITALLGLASTFVNEVIKRLQPATA